MDMKSNNIGKLGEVKAVEYLKSHNYSILKTNYHSRYGEIDIIAEKNNIICFIEVKTRKKNAYITPSEFVNHSKQNKIMMTANSYIISNFSEKFSYRFDIIEVFHYNSYIFEINHLKGAFEL